MNIQEFKELTATLVQQREELNEKFQALQDHFDSIVGNSEIPLAERWVFFVNAPDDYYNHASDMTELSDYPLLARASTDILESGEVGKGVDVNIIDFMYCIKEDGTVDERYMPKWWTKEEVMGFMEQVLESHYATFTVDW